MSGTTEHGIRYPDGASKAKDLGRELETFAKDVDKHIDDRTSAVGLEGIVRDVAEDVVPEIVPPVVDEYLDNNPRIPRNQWPGTFAVLDRLGVRFSALIDALGRATIPDLRTMIRRIGTATEIAGINSDEHVFLDNAGRKSFHLRRNGTVWIGRLEADMIVGAGSGGGAAPVERVEVSFIIGQSNPSGRGRPTTSRTDPPHSRVLMWDHGSQEIVRATVPLSTHDNAPGYSLATAVAADHAARTGAETRVVVVNSCVGSTGLVNETPNGVWDPDYTGDRPHLYAQAKSDLQQALARIAVMYPDADVSVWVYWHQGESDNDTPRAVYAAALDKLIDRVRSDFGDETIPFTAGGFVPERVEGTPLINVRAALIDLPARVPFTAYTDGIPNGGGSADPYDQTHYTRQGAEALGHAMFRAAQRAATASDDQVPHAPLHVTAHRSGSTVYVSWSEPDTRWTRFVVEYSVAGGSWQVAPRTYDALNSEKITVSGSGEVRVRIKSVNGATVAQPSTPVIAFGA